MASPAMRLFWPGLTLCTACLSGVMCGILFVFSNAILPSLQAQPAAEAVAAMQTINLKVINPLFMIVLLGPVAGSVLLAVYAFLGSDAGVRGWLLAGCALYIVGVMVVTGVGNVPLNNALAQAHPANAAQAGAMWDAFAGAWQRWNNLRTVASLLATLSFTMAFARMQTP